MTTKLEKAVIEQVVSGRAHRDIAKELNIPISWIKEIMNDADVKERERTKWNSFTTNGYNTDVVTNREGF